MKHKNSILICQLDNGQLNLYANGAGIGEIIDKNYKEIISPKKLANNKITYEELKLILEDVLYSIPVQKEK